MRSGLPPSLFRGPAGAGRRGGGGGCRALLGRFNAFLGFNRTWLTLPVVISLGPLFRFAAPTFPRTRGGGAPRGWGRRGGGLPGDLGGGLPGDLLAPAWAAWASRSARRPASAGAGGAGAPRGVESYVVDPASGDKLGPIVPVCP